MDVQAWSDRLTATFISDANAYKMVDSVLKKEKEHSVRAVQTLRGHTLLCESLQSFLLQSFNELVQQNCQPNPLKPSYGLFTFEFTQIFRTLRQSEILYYHGYPMASYMLQRNLKDRVFLLCAIGNRESNYRAIFGIDSNYQGAIDSIELENIRKRSLTEEKCIFDLLLRKSQNLGQYKDPLLKWDRQFNSEVHLQKVSMAQHLLSSANSNTGIPLFPIYDENISATYVNRGVELGWMVTRLLPLMQSKPGEFSSSWATKWAILEDSFMLSNKDHRSIGKQGLNELSLAVEFFINLRFNFNPNISSYDQCID